MQISKHFGEIKLPLRFGQKSSNRKIKWQVAHCAQCIESNGQYNGGAWQGGRIIMQAACAIIVLLSFPLYVSPAACQEAWPKRANEREREAGGGKRATRSSPCTLCPCTLSIFVTAITFRVSPLTATRTELPYSPLSLSLSLIYLSLFSIKQQQAIEKANSEQRQRQRLLPVAQN